MSTLKIVNYEQQVLQLNFVQYIITSKSRCTTQRVKIESFNCHFNKKVVLSQGGPQNAAANLGMYQIYSGIVQFSLWLHGFWII